MTVTANMLYDITESLWTRSTIPNIQAQTIQAQARRSAMQQARYSTLNVPYAPHSLYVCPTLDLQILHDV